MSYCFRLIFIVSLVFSIHLVIATNIVEAKEFSINSIKGACEESAPQCLIETDLILKELVEPNLLKYDVILLKMEALYTLQKQEELIALINKWQNKKNTSLYFQTKSYYYLAKSSRDDVHFRKYLKEALRLLALANDTYPDPMLLIDIAILQQNFVEQHLPTYQALQKLAENFKNRDLPLFQRELYTALGHFAKNLAFREQEQEYRKKAIFWSEKHGNIQQIGIATHNLARAYQAVDNWERATQLFEKSLIFLEQANDGNSGYITKLRLIEVALQANERKLAKSLLLKLPTAGKEVPKYMKDIFIQLQFELLTDS